MDLTRETTTRFTFGPGISELPIWSPDGNEIVFSSNREGVFNLYRKPANGSREEELLLRTKQNKAAFGWSRDGKFLLYDTSDEPTFVKQDLWVLPMQGDRTPFPFLNSRFDEGFGAFSPDGHWVAYVSDETGRNEIYVRSFAGSPAAADAGGRWIISKDGGQGIARWRDDGKPILRACCGPWIWKWGPQFKRERRGNCSRSRPERTP
jgi:Tol biopolymer transport system component